MTREEIQAALELPREVFNERYQRPAAELMRTRNGGGITVAALLALGNICRNNCTYCGLRADNDQIPRFRLSRTAMLQALDGIREKGLDRLFLISGDDPHCDWDGILTAVAEASGRGFRVMLGLGVLTEPRYRELKEAGAELYALKFETSREELFTRVKPEGRFDERMEAIRRIQACGLKLGTGSLMGLPGETLEDAVSDILLTRELQADWAPIVPFLPAPGTPLADRPMGNVDRVLRSLSLLRLMKSEILLTAGQPAQGSRRGFADPDGNRAALAAGADLLFVDVTPPREQDTFSVTANRILPRLEAIDGMLAGLGLQR